MITATAHSIAFAPPPAVTVLPGALKCNLMVLHSTQDYFCCETAVRRMPVLPRVFGPGGH
ncbi:hypothetical protein A1D31_13105 [Bradyrhizobium liaoningense]|nr:hypothetical protein A1D31_13105 [Bradyrhizobium liaoningense]